QGFDLSSLYYDAQIAIKEGQHFEGTYVIHNEQRDVGVITGSTITEYYGPDGLPEDTIIVKTSGHAGQSIAAFAPQG
ncbi:hypothetical protein, partial [Streptococcus anginosus]